MTDAFNPEYLSVFSTNDLVTFETNPNTHAFSFVLQNDTAQCHVQRIATGVEIILKITKVAKRTIPDKAMVLYLKYKLFHLKPSQNKLLLSLLSLPLIAKK